MNQMTQSILIITDDQALAHSLLRLARTVFTEGSVKASIYAKTPGLLSARLADTDIFILGLLRQYPGGLRAEGVALAGLLIPRGKKVF
ncbi:MAG: hypothetical protein KDL10_08035, partial [Kiritimatiellae bacterium]|nr:hypothetical protein [Kiritimatiellia bacterium]